MPTTQMTSKSKEELADEVANREAKGLRSHAAVMVVSILI